jgi:O-antigen/teichoic acid export membrane protein
VESRPPTSRPIVLPSAALAAFDQALSSASNFLVSVVAARWLPPAQFGYVAIAIVYTYAFTAVLRATVSEPILVFLPITARDRASAYAAKGLGSSFLLGLVAIALAIPILAARPGELPPFLALAMPALCLLALQDTYRYLAFATANGWYAVASDAAWLVGQGAFFGVAALLNGGGGPAVVGGWTFGMASGLVVAVVLLRIRPTLRAVIEWLRETRPYWAWMLSGVVTTNTLLLAQLVLVSALLGPATAGGIRAAQLIATPVNILLLSVQLVLVPQFARLAALGQPDSNRQVRTKCLHGAWQLGILVAVPVALIYLARIPLLGQLFGSSYQQYSYLVGPLLTATIALALSIPAGSALRAMQRTRQLFVVSAIAAVTGTVALLFAILLLPSQAIGWAIAVPWFMLCILSWYVFLSATRSRAAVPASSF